MSNEIKKELVDLTTYMEQTLDIEKARMFVSNFKNYEAVFTQEILTKALSKFQVKNFATFKDIQVEYSRYYEERYPRYSQAHLGYFSDYIIKNGETYEARIQKTAYSYIIPDQYQLKEKELLKECLFLSIPELEKFEWDMYHLDSYTDSKTKEIKYSDIYLKTSEGSLYCPIDALIRYDKKAIIERHSSYHKGYYNTADRKEYLNKSLMVLKTLSTELLFYVLDCYKKNEKVDFVQELSPAGKEFLERVKRRKAQKENKHFVTYSLKDTIKSVTTPNVSVEYLVEENEEYVVVTINNKTTRTNITGLTSRDIVRHVLFDIGE